MDSVWLWVIGFIIFIIIIVAILWFAGVFTPAKDAAGVAATTGNNTWLWVFGGIFLFIIIIVIAYMFLGGSKEEPPKPTEPTVIVNTTAPVETPIEVIEEPAMQYHDHYHAAPKTVTNNYNNYTMPEVEENIEIFESAPRPRMTAAPKVRFEPRPPQMERTVPIQPRSPTRPVARRPAAAMPRRNGIPIESEYEVDNPGLSQFDPDPIVRTKTNPIRRERVSGYEEGVGPVTGTLTTGGDTDYDVIDYANHKVRIAGRR